MRTDDAVERRDHLGVAVVDLGKPGIGLGLLEIGLGVVAGRRRGVEGGLRYGLPLHQIALSLEVGFRLLERGLRAGFGRLRLIELELVGLGLDREQLGALLDEGAVLIVDRLQEALHPCHQIDALDRRGIAGGLDIARDRALHGYGDVHLGRRRCHEAVLVLAARERDYRRDSS